MAGTRWLGLLLLLVLAPVASAGDQEQLVQLLEDFLSRASEADRENHERFWSDELVYTSSAGERFGKQKILEGIDATPEPSELDEPVPTYGAEETDIRVYGRTAVVAFTLVATWDEDGETRQQRYFNTGTFLKKRGEWRAVAWQATKVPPDETGR